MKMIDIFESDQATGLVRKGRELMAQGKTKEAHKIKQELVRLVGKEKAKEMVRGAAAYSAAKTGEPDAWRDPRVLDKK